MTVKFTDTEPKWNCFYAEVDKKNPATIWQDGDVVFDVDAPDGGTIAFTLTIADMEEIVEKYNEYIEKRALLIKAINDPKAQG